MFDQKKFNEWLARYKNDFEQNWKDEEYKWWALKQFQDTWDIDAKDFPAMLEMSLSKTLNLLHTGNFFPRDMIIKYANQSPDQVRSMFRNLFDESKDKWMRISNFMDEAKQLQKLYPVLGKTHYQNVTAVTTYLWLKFPNTYYIYRYRYAKDVSESLNSTYTIKMVYTNQNLENFYNMYEEIRQEFLKDSELVGMYKEHITKDCYPDPYLFTLTTDFGHYIRHQLETKEKKSKESPASQSKVSTTPITHEEATTPSSPVTSYEAYSDSNFLSEVFMDKQAFTNLKYLLKEKQNVILQGPPGVGKTFAAEKLAYAIMGKKDKSHIDFVQFHQNYSYEDFIMGYKPTETGFKLKKGVFYKFCEKAANDPDPEQKYFFIIDEINRGNLSKIFGELFMLIEKGYRGTELSLPYDDVKPFSVPKNVYIIGTMNTADRSLAMMDYALRRRFCFFTMEPGFDSAGFKTYKEQLNNSVFNTLVEKIKELNHTISNDSSLGKGFCIGHSYLCGIDTKHPEDCTPDWMRSVVNYEILPMLEEYWFDTPEKVETWRKELNGVFHDEGK